MTSASDADRETAEVRADATALRAIAEAREAVDAGDVVYGTDAVRALLQQRAPGQNDGGTADELVHRVVVDGVATITLDSPRNRNALSAQLRRELQGHLDTAITDPAVRVIVLTHTGPVFCSGMDLRESRGAAADAQGVNEFPAHPEHDPDVPDAGGGAPGRPGAGRRRRAWSQPATSPWPPTPRRSRSPRSASAWSRRSSPSPCSPGCSPAPPASCSSPARRSTPPAPLPIGLINAAVPADRLDAEVARYVGLLRLGAPGALAATKALLQRPLGDDLDSAFAAMQELSARHFASAEGQEGMAAFAEKRPPSWVRPEK